MGFENRAAALVLGSVAALHALWAAGSSFPCANTAELARLTTGAEEMPGPIPCLVVAGGLGVAAIASWPDEPGPTLRVVRRGASAALALRGIIGAVPAAKALGLPSPNQRFRELDAKFYRRCCLALAWASRTPRAAQK